MTQVVDLYRGAFKTLHYKRLIWGSREGFLMLNADKDPKKVQAVMGAMMKMVKLDVAEMERAYDEA
jgi:hypothetical protein